MSSFIASRAFVTVAAVPLLVYAVTTSSPQIAPAPQLVSPGISVEVPPSWYEKFNPFVSNLDETPLPQQVAMHVAHPRVKPKVLTMEDMGQADDVTCLAKNIYFEAGVEPTAGKYAVAQVTMNRVASGRWGDNVCSVVYAKDQFSWTKQVSKYDQDHPAQGNNWNESVAVAKDVLNNGATVANLQKAMFYHAETVRPYWRDMKAKITQIGGHIFYSRARGDDTDE